MGSKRSDGLITRVQILRLHGAGVRRACPLGRLRTGLRACPLSGWAARHQVSRSYVQTPDRAGGQCPSAKEVSSNLVKFGGVWRHYWCALAAGSRGQRQQSLAFARLRLLIIVTRLAQRRLGFVLVARGFSRKGSSAGVPQCYELLQYFLNRSALQARGARRLRRRCAVEVGSTPAHNRTLRQGCLVRGVRGAAISCRDLRNCVTKGCGVGRLRPEGPGLPPFREPHPQPASARPAGRFLASARSASTLRRYFAPTRLQPAVLP